MAASARIRGDFASHLDYTRPVTSTLTVLRNAEIYDPAPRGRHDVVIGGAAIPFFTTNVSSLLRLPKKGRIAIGADADLVSLDDAHRIRDVMARGRFVVRAGAPVVRGTFEAT